MQYRHAGLLCAYLALIAPARANVVGELEASEPVVVQIAPNSQPEGNTQWLQRKRMLLGSANNKVDQEFRTPSGNDILHMRTLCTALTTVGIPGIGFSADVAGWGFAPAPSYELVEVGWSVATDSSKYDPVIAEIVGLGPLTIPILLGALEDPTPTGVRVTNLPGRMGLWKVNALVVNPGSERERNACDWFGLAAADNTGAAASRGEWTADVDEHVVSRGDLAFALLGQIVNRPYAAIAYKPSGAVSYCSTSRDSRFAAAVRTIWSSDDYSVALFDSLVADLAAKGSIELQYGAALRLRRYFPVTSGPVLAAFVSHLHAYGDLDAEPMLCQGVEYDCYPILAAIATDPCSVLLDALLSVVANASDVGQVCELLMALDRTYDAKEFADHCLSAIIRLKGRGQSGGIAAVQLFSNIATCCSRLAPAVLSACVATADVTIIECAVLALGRSGRSIEWSMGSVISLLNDTREMPASRGASKYALRERICDAVARLVVACEDGDVFDTSGDRALLDARIRELRGLGSELRRLASVLTQRFDDNTRRRW